MICEEDKRRLNEAKTCDDCLCWHKHCHAECCKRVYILQSPAFLFGHGKYLIVKTVLSKDLQWYYRLRNIRYHHGVLRFPKERCIGEGDHIIYVQTCAMLKGNLCEGHPDKRPQMCKDLVLETASQENSGYYVTENCLFKYKRVEDDEKTETEEVEGTASARKA